MLRCATLLMELDGLNSNAVLRQYTWGLDLSGQNGNPSVGGIHGAGGIGGLLAMRSGSSLSGGAGPNDGSYLYFYNANGDVGQLIKTSSEHGDYGTTAARYEYYPFGGDLVSVFNPSSGSNPARNNPFRFSTKYRDNESKCYYYGYRYLRPKHGRWISRDPIGERGGAALYQFGMNAPTVAIDALGEEFINSGATGKDVLWWYGGKAGMNNESCGSIQKNIPPEIIKEGCCCRVKPGTGEITVSRSYTSVVSGDQGLGTVGGLAGRRGCVSPKCAVDLDAHEAGHVFATGIIYTQTIYNAEVMASRYKKRKLCCDKKDCATVLAAIIAWDHWVSEFVRIDTEVNCGSSLFHQWETNMGGGPSHNSGGAVIGRARYGDFWRSRREVDPNYRLPPYNQFRPPVPKDKPAVDDDGCATK